MTRPSARPVSSSPARPAGRPIHRPAALVNTREIARPASRPRWLPDTFMLLLLSTVALASLLPARGAVAEGLGHATTVAVGLLFFLHGARLSRGAIWAGICHWRAHLLVFGSTFALFPLLGLALRPVLGPLVTPELYLGVLFLCALPSTVQASIALTSMARGNMPVAICSASSSTLLGILVTPLLVGLMLVDGATSHDPLASMGRIALQLLLPFALGQLLRPLIGGVMQRCGPALKVVDQGSILLVVYAAFGQAVIDGIWSKVPLSALAGLAVICAILLALTMGLLVWSCRRLGLSTEDEIAILFCGSKKSLVSGVPMANVLFAANVAGAIVLPLMLFHQLQLMVCTVVARRYALRPEAVAATAIATPTAAAIATPTAAAAATPTATPTATATAAVAAAAMPVMGRAATAANVGAQRAGSPVREALPG